MATLVLGGLGAVIGGIVGGPNGALLGFNIGSLIGGLLFAPRQQDQSRGKLDDLRITGSSYGSSIPMAWGSTRLGGTIIWATDLVEHSHTDHAGKGGGASVKTYNYTSSFAVSVCEGPVHKVRRIWAEDLLVYDDDASPRTKYDVHFPYLGTETQGQDALMVATLGADATPAYRGQVVVVFENMDLTNWGNRLPAMSFELVADPAAKPTVSGVLADVAGRCGLAPSVDYDFSDAVDQLEGFAITQRQQAYQAVEQLLHVSATDMCEVDGRLVAVRRGGESYGVVLSSDMGARDWSAGSDPPERVKTTRKSDLSLPFKYELGYVSLDRLYEQSVQAGIRHSRERVQDQKTVSTLVTMHDADARSTAGMLLDVEWLERASYVFTVGLKWLGLAPATPFTAEIGGSFYRLRVMQLDVAPLSQVAVTAVLDGSVGELGASEGYRLQLATASYSPPAFNAGTEGAIVPTTFDAWSGPEFRDLDGVKPGFYVAATGPVGWNGATIYYSTDGDHWSVGGFAAAKADFGFAVNALPSAPGLDIVNPLSVQLYPTGALMTASVVDVTNGVNAALVGSEVLSFEDVAAAGGALAYTLTRLHRGERSSPTSGHAANERFWHLSDALARVTVDQSLVGQTVHVRLLSPGQAIGDVASVDVVIAANHPPYTDVATVTAMIVAGGGSGVVVEAEDGVEAGPSAKLNVIAGARMSSATAVLNGDGDVDLTLNAAFQGVTLEAGGGTEFGPTAKVNFVAGTHIDSIIAAAGVGGDVDVTINAENQSGGGGSASISGEQDPAGWASAAGQALVYRWISNAGAPITQALPGLSGSGAWTQLVVLVENNSGVQLTLVGTGGDTIGGGGDLLLIDGESCLLTGFTGAHTTHDWAVVYGPRVNANTVRRRAVTASYTLVREDAGRVVEATSASAMTVTVPPSSFAVIPDNPVNFPVGTIVEVWQGGAGVVTVAAGLGVTLLSRAGLLVTNGQYSQLRLRYQGTDVWQVTGV